MLRNQWASTGAAALLCVLQAVLASGCASQIFLDDQQPPDSRACDAARTAASSSDQDRQPPLGGTACSSP